MPCYHPLQAVFSVRKDGKKDVKFSAPHAKMFEAGVNLPSFMKENHFQIPCGRCMGCRLEKSRQWATRIMHEASLYEENCFLTLTFSQESLQKECPDGSLSKRHVQTFMKRLRFKFSDRKIRVFYCGEYGEKLQRPHYHLCIFNFSFPDRTVFSRRKGMVLYTSPVLEELWPFGHHAIGELNFESAAYVARYCTKKITGSQAEDHYGGRQPEFAQMSLKPGIGRGWIEKWGSSDVFPHDYVVVRKEKCTPPRYYDRYLESINPDLLAKHKEQRIERAKMREDDNTYRRLLVKEKCQEARFKQLVRTLEMD